jgi:hypothetical protein
MMKAAVGEARIRKDFEIFSPIAFAAGLNLFAVGVDRR